MTALEERRAKALELAIGFTGFNLAQHKNKAHLILMVADLFEDFIREGYTVGVDAAAVDEALSAVEPLRTYPSQDYIGKTNRLEIKSLYP